MEEKLVKAEKLASIGELAVQLGHDLRNPLAAIKNGIYVIRKKDNQLERAKKEELLNHIENAIEDSDRIIASLLDYSSELKCRSSALLSRWSCMRFQTFMFLTT